MCAASINITRVVSFEKKSRYERNLENLMNINETREQIDMTTRIILKVSNVFERNDSHIYMYSAYILYLQKYKNRSSNQACVILKKSNVRITLGL